MGNTSDPRSDQELIAAANAGEEGAFVALYERYREWVLRLARRFTHSEADALDVLQETFLYLLKKFPHFMLTSAMTTFLYPVVRNLSLALHRKRRPELAGEELLESVAGPIQPGSSELAAVLAVLPQAQREVLLMRFVDEMSLEEIALALHIPLGTVKSRMHNALGMLREDERTRRYFGKA